MMYRSIIIFSVLISAVAIWGCNKDNTKSGTTVTIIKISYSGVRLPGDTLTFRCNAPAGSSYLWDFGDQTGTSSKPTPTHVYSGIGSYEVTLVLNGNTITPALRQGVEIVGDPGYTRNLAGSWQFHHSLNGINLPDTSLTIVYLDPLDVQIGADTLPFSSNNGNELYFIQDYPGKLNSPFELTLNYGYITNSIYFQKYTEVSSGSSTQTISEFFEYP